MKLSSIFSSRKNLKNILIILVASYGIIIAMLCFLKWTPQWANKLDNTVYDYWMTITPQPEPHPLSVIVDIDDRSLDEYGQWPWPRHRLADLVNKLYSCGASVIAFNILLSEPDRNSPDIIADELFERFGVHPDFREIPPHLLNNDLVFRDEIKDKPVVLGMFPNFDAAGEIPSKLPKSVSLHNKELTPRILDDLKKNNKTTDSFPTADSVQMPLPLFTDVATVGVMNAEPDSDGVIRKVPLIVKIGDKFYVNLGLRALMLGSARSGVNLFYGENGLEKIGFKNHSVPVSPDGYFHPLFRPASSTFNYISADDVLKGYVGPEDFQNRIVFVGSSALGLKDQISSPTNPVMAGVETHATIVGNILRQKGFVQPVWAINLQVAAIVVTALLASTLFVISPPVIYIPMFVLLVAGCIFGSWLSFFNGYIISPIYAISSIMLAAMTLLPIRIFQQEKSRRQLRNIFSHYVAEGVMAKILKDGGKPLAGEDRNVTILFTDIRSFSSIAEKLPPDKLVGFLNKYFSAMTSCITLYEGTMDKFIGDALMAFWNAPLNVHSHELKAVNSAMEMMERLKVLQPELHEEFGIDLKIGAGIHSGHVYVGNMGSNELHDYTCIGETVNLASRLEGMCKVYGAKIVVSERVKDACGGQYLFRQLDHVMVKGSTFPIRIFTPIEHDATIDINLEKEWQSALNAYFAGSFNEAAVIFARLAKNSRYEKGATLFLKRCRDFAANPPGYWDGIWKYNTK